MRNGVDDVWAEVAIGGCRVESGEFAIGKIAQPRAEPAGVAETFGDEMPVGSYRVNRRAKLSASWTVVLWETQSVDGFGAVRGMARSCPENDRLGDVMTGSLGYARVSTRDQDVAGQSV
jgi:hypothetical protein